MRSFIRFLRPGDIVVVLVYIGLFLLFLFLSLRNLGDAGSLYIQSSGVEYRYDLGTPRLVEFEGPIGKTVLEIDGEGRARFIHSDCRDQICVRSGYLERGGEWAACLPNRIIAMMDRQYKETEGVDVDAGTY